MLKEFNLFIGYVLIFYFFLGGTFKMSEQPKEINLEDLIAETEQKILNNEYYD